METTTVMTLDTYQMERMFEALRLLHNDRNLYNRKLIAQFVFDNKGELGVSYYDANTGDAINIKTKEV